MPPALCARLKGDEGFGLVLVVGMTAVISTLLIVVFAIARGSLESSISHVSFERAINVAESGVDQTLGRLQKAYDTGGGDFPVPAPSHPTCTAPTVSAPSFANEDDEKAWARQELETLRATAACVQSTGEGEFVVLKPANRQVVYSLGATPAFDQPRAKTRLLKSEYLFSPYRPSNALLTGAKLCISGSVLVDATNTSIPANVHTNGDVATSCGNGGGSGSGSGTIEGTLTASGSYTVNSNVNVAPGSGGGTAKQGMPVVDPRDVYFREYAKYAGRWYDLCSDGTAKIPTSAGPCATTDPSHLLYTYQSGDLGFQGWTYSPGSSTGAPVWSMTTKSSPYSGVYYVHQGDAVVGGNGSTNPSDPAWNATVIAESKLDAVDASLGTCGKLGGNIEWKLENIRNMMTGTVFFAHADLAGSANSHAENGMFIAGDQVYLNTSSGSLRGAVIAADQCPNSNSPNSVQGFSIYYDGSVEAPLSSIIRSTLWLEYVGG
jgi:hypothetical protein